MTWNQGAKLGLCSSPLPTRSILTRMRIVGCCWMVSMMILFALLRHGKSNLHAEGDGMSGMSGTTVSNRSTIYSHKHTWHTNGCSCCCSTWLCWPAWINMKTQALQGGWEVWAKQSKQRRHLGLQYVLSRTSKLIGPDNIAGCCVIARRSWSPSLWQCQTLYSGVSHDK